MKIVVPNPDFQGLEEIVNIWVRSWRNPELLEGIEQGKHYTFKVVPRQVSSETGTVRDTGQYITIWTNWIAGVDG